MIRFERTRDLERIRRVICDPAVYPWMSADGGPAPEDYTPADPESRWYMQIIDCPHNGQQSPCAVGDGDELLGLFILVPVTNVCLEVHTCILPAGRGARAREAYRAGIAWVWANTGTQKIIGNIPAYNRAAVRIALESGCELIGINRRAQRKRGKLRDIVIVGIERE